MTALIERVEHLGADRPARAAAPEPEPGAGADSGAGADARPIGLFIGLAVLDVIQLVEISCVL